ncbi:MAG: phosphate ABC transporter permease PstA [Lachnospirales bacterium]
MSKIKDNFFKAVVIFMTITTITVLLGILGYIFVKGISGLNLDLFNEILPMLVTTIITIVVTLLIATPIGIFTAVFLNEYSKKGNLVSVIRFSVDVLVGIPSIVYGLFGMILFVVNFQFGYSIIAGCLTLSIIVLPTIIKMTEEALVSVPMAYREASYGLGVGKLNTIYKIILPSAYKGILNGIILSIGRIVGESAAVLYTIGTVPYMPKSIFSSGETLSVYMYMQTKEGFGNGISQAFSVALVLIILVMAINFTAYKLGSSIGRA